MRPHPTLPTPSEPAKMAAKTPPHRPWAFNITLGPLKIPVSFVDREDEDLEDLLGVELSGPSGIEIKLSDELEGNMIWSTLFHELIHAFSDMGGLDLSEKTVRWLDNQFATFVRSNPKLARDMIEGLQL